LARCRSHDVAMSRWLVGAAFAWPLVLAFGLWQRVADPRAVAGRVVYGVASLICHQIPGRSFSAAGVPWPVCGRCAGLYAAAPLGALIAFARVRRRPLGSARRVIAIAALPTLATLGVEWIRPDIVGNVSRFVAALPLGWAIAMVLVDTAATPAAHET